MKKNKKQCFGVIIGTRAYFNSELARDVRKQLLKTLEDEGYDYIILPEDATPTGSSSIETREDGLKCAELFRQHRDELFRWPTSAYPFWYRPATTRTTR